MRRPGEGTTLKRVHHNRHQLKQVKGLFVKLSIAAILLISSALYFFYFYTTSSSSSDFPSEVDVNKLWDAADSGGWRPSSVPRSHWPPPPSTSNGYLRVRCNGGLNQQRTAICNAVLAARIMNATLVLPELDANSYWHDDSGFQGIYDVHHFIKSLQYDVRIVESIPEIKKNGKTKKIKAFQAFALEKMKEHGAIYLTPFSHRLAEEINNPEYQRLRCRVNYHALIFKPHIMELSHKIVDKLRSQGHFMSIHLRFEMDMLSFAGCFDIFSPDEQKILKKYRKENFAEKKLIYSERRAIGKCPLTPEERFMKPFRSTFPLLENHSTVDSSDELKDHTQGLLGSAVDYMVCLLSDIFMPTYDGPSNFANNLLGHRLYHGFRTAIRPDRKGLAPIFIDREKGRTAGFEEAVRRVMLQTNFGGPHKRISPESFYTNSWSECFCQTSALNPADRCPPDNITEMLQNRMKHEVTSNLNGNEQDS
ncbi:GDP-fucose protein O-fucosyltransferase [Cynara cardunculus var. scolymus]|uniref:O-fucosyltransferase family protein n=1 Tax=Cynara cardunculus var. scolymus TaxID=59895 RepID=A0A103YFQ6_CYNCS|nr:GDP-fucose protein O-fucosyltransferase [Cynara cardunculus var. scolymus]